jgi:hypothetical protein
MPSLYWIPKCPFKQCYISRSVKCSTKPLTKILPYIISVVKTLLQSYCDTSYSRGGVNQMWILKNSKDMLEYIQWRSLSSSISLKYLTYLHSTQLFLTLSWRTGERIRCFMKKNSQHRNKYSVLGRDISHFAKKKQTLWFCQNVLWQWYYQHARVFYWQHTCDVWWTYFSTDSRHTYGYKWCSSSRRLVPVFVWGKLHTGTSQEKRKETSPIL